MQTHINKAKYHCAALTVANVSQSNALINDMPVMKITIEYNASGEAIQEDRCQGGVARQPAHVDRWSHPMGFGG